MNSGNYTRSTSSYTTDVLVIGGGLAGLMAAISAVEVGASVIVLDKAHPRRSGAAAGGIDHLFTLMYPESQLDDFVKKQAEVCGGLVDHRFPAMFRNSRSVLEFLEGIGVQVRDSKSGQLVWVVTSSTLDQKVTLSIEGGDLKIKLFEAAVSKGVRILPRTMATNLLTDGKKVVGAIGLNVREGSVAAFRAKTVVIATGLTMRMYKATAGLRFNTGQCPYNTGDGQAMALRAGAELLNMEITTTQPSTKGYSTSGISGVTSTGAHFINALGDRFMARYDPERMENAAKSTLARAFLTETREGRAPLFVDFRHLSDEQFELLLRGFQEEVPTLLQFFRQSGIDLRKDPVEFELREFASGQGPGGGIRLIDPSCQASLAGLYAAGECMGGKGWVGAMGAMIFGRVAGREAAIFSQGASYSPVDPEQIECECTRVLAPLSRSEGITWQQAEDKLKLVMSEYVGFQRNEVGLRKGLERLSRLKADVSRLKAKSAHELMRVLEVTNLIETAICVATAALARTESRLVPYHFRSDYPLSDDENWLRFVVVRQIDGEVQTSPEPIPKG